MKSLLASLVFAVCLVSPSFASKRQTILVVTAPCWGTVVSPTSGTSSYKLSATTGIVSVVSGLGFLFGDGYAGSYLITGLSSRNISYSVAIGPFSGSGVSVTSAYIGGNASSGSGTLSVLGTLAVGIGGVLQVSSGATGGSQTATVTVTVNYS